MNRKDLSIILKQGEDYRIEFKENISGVEKDLVAFANSSGGRIFLGITDKGKIRVGKGSATHYILSERSVHD
jgi:ATP-dependent DNA helicase RecG